MPDASGAAAVLPQIRPQRERRRVSPLLRRILLVNMVAPALLAASVLYLDQYQTGLLSAEVEGLRTQARIYAAGIAEAAVRLQDDRAVLVPDSARPLLRRLVEPSANTQAKLFDTSGLLVADSRVREGQGGAIITEPLTPPKPQGLFAGGIGRFYDRLVTILPRSLFGARRSDDIHVDVAPDAPSFDWQPELGPDRREELRLALEGGVRPYIRRTREGRLLVSVAEPARRGSQSIGIVLLTREAREVDQRLLEIRTSVLGLFILALLLTVAASLYLSRTIASPILALAGAAAAMRQGKGRAGSVPTALLARTDEIGILARDLQSSATALWARIDQNERFAADVAHELRNPLTSVRSALETLLRVEKPDQQKRLLSIIAEDAVRMDRLIGDIADSSRVDAELSRTVSEPVDVAPILSALVDLHNTTRDEEEDPVMVLDAAPVPLVVRGVEGRIVQVFRNLLGNAVSFSPPKGTVWVRARQTGAMMEFTIEDEGPGIPEAKLEGIFDRFYTERPTSESFGQHSGLGLSISRQIVEGLGGRISAENRRNESGKVIGARFVVRLPVG
ncbi:stimulus-sensing domain-containing protein [Roseomonas marmotae]|uniref:histidine kinase n=1 Tax=Roseomonas marmotae TaxID=2768161 RepID=A0ABS3KDZ6_9PROT|nr:stimulus-sensing domain-containing protein [Roseomonas marmotae]MBO1075684.1 stimulus-sensing domain-containing protein [Roseomonas marmotae]QTI79542.1 stimulus-sensing domain-containing protein [Roseomonas marmotae]